MFDGPRNWRDREWEIRGTPAGGDFFFCNFFRCAETGLLLPGRWSDRFTIDAAAAGTGVSVMQCFSAGRCSKS